MKRMNLKRLLNFRADDSGSTIVGVLAALVFIGIVTAFMVKNTGAQSAASIGYGTALTMHSTVTSGMVATEGFFLNDANRAVAFIGMVDSIKKNGGAVGTNGVVFAGANKEKERRKLSAASSDQFFSSKLGTYKNRLNTSDSCVDAEFVVAAGKNSKGKELRTGRAFYRFENLSQTQVPINGPRAKNAVFAGTGISNADAALNVTKGGATFMGKVVLQNYGSVFEKMAYFGDTVELPAATMRFQDKVYFMGYAKIQGETVFDGAAYFGADANRTTEFTRFATFNNVAQFERKVLFTQGATFRGWVRFDNEVTFQGPSTYYNETYFGKLVTFQNGAPTFYHRVGFDGDFDVKGLTMLSKANDTGAVFDVWMNGKFINIGAIGIQGTGISGHDLRVSTKFTISDTSKCKNFDTKGRNSELDATVLGDSRFKSINNSTKIVPLHPDSLKDPQLSLKPLYKDTIRVVNGETVGTVKIVPAVVAMTTCEKVVNAYGSSYCEGGTTAFNIASLNKAYQDGEKDGYLYNGYLVVRVKKDDPGINWGENPGTFNYKLIIIVDDGAKFDTQNKFYISGAESSTLLYVGPGNASIEQFGSNGLFRGFIYIDSANTSQTNSIQFTGNGRIQGAVHNFSDKNKLKWNGGNSQNAIPIEFDTGVLDGFASLYQTSTTTDQSSNGGVVLKPGTTGIEVKTLGIYFH